jgi:hypothetical protein
LTCTRSLTSDNNIVAAANERKAANTTAKNNKKAAEIEANEAADWAKGAKGNKKEAEEQKRVRVDRCCFFLGSVRICVHICLRYPGDVYFIGLLLLRRTAKANNRATFGLNTYSSHHFSLFCCVAMIILAFFIIRS